MKPNIKAALKDLKRLRELQENKNASHVLILTLNADSRWEVGGGINKTLTHISEHNDLPGVRDSTVVIVDDMILSCNMYLPLDFIYWYCSPEGIKEFIRLAESDDEVGYMASYIELFRSMVDANLQIPDDSALQDLAENHDRLTIEELVERYKDQRFFIPAPPVSNKKIR